MAEIEKTEFTFPDEQEEANERKGGRVVTPEADEKPEVKADEDDNIEIIDDTPARDRNKVDVTEPIEEVKDEELTKYSEGVKKRIKRFSDGYHTERRAKEQAEREKEEAIRLAQTVLEENKKLKGSVNQNQTALLEQAKKVVSGEVEAAKRMYREAYESGDTDKLVEAQEALTMAKIRADKVNNFRPTPLQVEETPVQIAQQPTRAAPVDEKLLDWQEKNQWFGSNKRMTAYALGLHEDLIGEGIPSGSDEYYRRIDTDMRERFSEQFGAEESVEVKPSQRVKSNNVAPATRSTAPRKVVLTQTQVNIAKRLGVPLELYARKVAEEMRK